MAQIFGRGANTIAKVSIVSVILLVAGSLGLFAAIIRSSYMTRVGVAREQPIPFSHKHHVSQLGIDCRYCHASVEVSHFAGMPPTHTCMSCHSQIWVSSPMLEPVRASYRNNESIAWTRLHDLPNFVYFNHSIHVKKGIGCQSCHGSIDQMEIAYKSNSLYMEWCLNCHREPEKYIRPREAIFDMHYIPKEPQEILGPKLVKEYKVQKLLDCYTCHR